jgi:hypothetical protein
MSPRPALFPNSRAESTVRDIEARRHRAEALAA